MRPRLELFEANEVDHVIDDAMAVLETVGVLVENEDALALARGHGLHVVDGRVSPTEDEVRRAIATAPSRFTVYDREGAPALELGGDDVHFDPGSAALYIRDDGTGRRRRPTTADLAHLAWVTEASAALAAQSTALVPADVPEVMSDRWRLYVALLSCRKPVVTGTFAKDGFAVMRDLLVAVRGNVKALEEQPLAIFDCCPTAPLSWSDLTCQALLDCARAAIPAQLVAMPLAGATAPMTLRETVVQHCAETMSGVLLHQLARPGAPVVYGGSPAAFDMRRGTTPMGAVETWMIDVAYAQVGKRLGLPTHAYMGPSDSKEVDFQAGSEAACGLALAALAGINLVSGPGMLDFENCQSLEKLVLDNELCASSLRLVRGIDVEDAPRAVDLIADAVRLGSMLGHPHTRSRHRREVALPGPLVDRSAHSDWEATGRRDARARAAAVVKRVIEDGNPAPLAEALTADLTSLMTAEARRLGIDHLPGLP